MPSPGSIRDAVVQPLGEVLHSGDIGVGSFARAQARKGHVGGERLARIGVERLLKDMRKKVRPESSWFRRLW